MKYKFIILFFFISLNSVLYAQEFRDQLSNEKISLVEFYSDDGDLIGITNVDGSISSDLKFKVNASKTKKITLVNSFFESRIININEFNDNAVFLMKPIVNELNEIVVSQKKDSHKYLILRTYVRSLQINNGSIHYFMDGIVEYYISLKTPKVKIKFLSNRSFENKSIKQLKEKGITSVFFQIVGAPQIDEILKYQKLNETYNFKKNDSEIKIFSKKNNLIKGNFIRNKNYGNLNLGIITNDNPKIMSGLGVENILLGFNVNSSYTTTAFEEINFENLLYFKESRSYNIKAKKDKEYQKINATHEVFVLDYRFSENADVKKTSSNYSFINSSCYSEEYWKKINNVMFQPLPESVEQFMNQNLIELKSSTY